MNLNTQDSVLKDYPPPCPVDGFVVRQQDHTGLDGSHLALGFGNRQTKPVASSWTCHSIPKLSNILMGILETGALGSKLRQRGVDDLVLRIRTPCHTKQDVRIDNTRWNNHLVVILVQPLT